MRISKIAMNLAIAAGLVMALSATKVTAHAEDHDPWNLDDHWTHNSDQKRIQKGFAIAPVPLNLDDKDRDLVGLGSYLVNAVAGCNDCHTNPPYAPGGDPFLHQKKRVNAKYYLGGGQHFGPFVSRNLTPENGLPAGRTYKEFRQILRTGVDLDHLHPQISDLLQVMPWPTFQDMNDHDIRAIYEYLRAIPPATPGP